MRRKRSISDCENMKYRYEINVDNILNLENSLKEGSISFPFSFTTKRKNKIYINNMRDMIENGYISGRKIYRDPDTCDLKLYKKIRDKYDFIKKNCDEVNKAKFYDKNIGICYTLDGISWKKIYDLCDGNIKEFINKYEMLRDLEKFGHLVWPACRPSINFIRGRVLNDRIDYTLQDIKNYFLGESSKLKNVYKSAATNMWLNTYFKSKDGKLDFNLFIDTMQLSRWCKKDENGKYMVIDLSNELPKDFFDSSNIRDLEKYLLNSEFEVKEFSKIYLENVMKIINLN